jgi:hypothetical protein
MMLFATFRLSGIYMVGAVSVLALSAYAEKLPCPDETMRKVVARSQRAPEEQSPALYRFSKNTVTEEFDARGGLKDRQEKVEQVIFKAGEFFRKSIRHEGKTVLDEQLGSDADGFLPDGLMPGDAQFDEYGRSKRGDYLQFLTPELIARYDFKVEQRLEMNQRPTLEISFRPKEKRLPARTMIERIYNEITGTLWIDEEDFEVARAYFVLQSEVPFLGGIAGVLRSGEIKVRRIRMDDGVWFNHVTDGDIRGRKLLESKRVKISSTSGHFQKMRRTDYSLN